MISLLITFFTVLVIAELSPAPKVPVINDEFRARIARVRVKERT